MKRSRRHASRRGQAKQRTEAKVSPLKKRQRKEDEDDLFLSQASVEVVWQYGEEVYERLSQDDLSQDLDVVMRTISSAAGLPQQAAARDDSVLSLWKGRDQLSQESTVGTLPTSQSHSVKHNGGEDPPLPAFHKQGGSKALVLMKNLMKLQKVESDLIDTSEKRETLSKAPLQPSNVAGIKDDDKRVPVVVSKEDSSKTMTITLDKENLSVSRSEDVSEVVLQEEDLMTEDDMKALQIAEELYHLQQLSDAFDFDESSCDSFSSLGCSKTAAQSVPGEAFAREPQHSILGCSTSTEESMEDEMDMELIRVAELAELSHMPKTQADDLSLSGSSQPTNPFQRYTVVSVQRSSNHLVSLQLYSEQSSEQRMAQLSGEWTRTMVNSGDIVHVIGSFDMEKNVPDIHISDEENFLVLHPDILLSGTAIGSSFKCLRLAVLSHRCKWPLQMGSLATSPLTPGAELREDLPPTRPPSTTPEMLYGEMVHLLFERSLVEGDFTNKFVKEQIDEIIAVNQLKLHSIGQETSQAQEKMAAYVTSLQEWARDHLHVKHSSSIPPRRGHTAPLCKQVHRVLAVEENIWSPRYGLQGKVDATVAVAVPRSNELQVAPLELKTGRVVSQYGQIPHRAQVALYTLMMEDRYSTPVQKGLLFYAKPPQNKMIDVFTPRNELKTLMLSRNEMAHYIHTSVSKAADRGMRGVPYGQGLLPPMLRDPRACGRCHQRANCFLYHKAAENGSSASSGVENLWEETVGHVGESEGEFFRKWERLIDLEAYDTHTVRQEIWTMTSADREALGRCCGGLSLTMEEEVSRCTPTPLSQTTEKGEELMTKKGFLYRFERRVTKQNISRRSSDVFPRSQGSGVVPGVSSGSLLSLHMGKGDFVVISTEEGHICLGRGIVQSITERSIMVMMDERLQLPPDPLNPTAKRTVAPVMGDIEDLAIDTHEILERFLWRVDKDDMTSIFNTMKANIFRLLLGQDRHATRLRDIVVNLKKPSFAEPGSDSVLSDEKIRDIVPEQLNGDQLSTIRTVLSAQDCALVLGMPGTGKTTTISCLVKALVAMNKSVLVTAYTHSAVDNLLFKLEELGVPFLRLGRTESIAPSLRKYCVNGSLSSLEELTTLVRTTHVLATTCLGVNDPLLSMKQFDYCIVDEASQLTLPVCLGPLFFAARFVLVGDHHQLPPLVRNEHARNQGMDESLFKRLSDAQPSAVVHLGVQYRMNADIMALSNHLTYGGRLRCGKAHGGESLQLPSLHLLPRPIDHTARPWIDEALAPQRRVLFMDTDPVPCPEASVGNATQNPNEVKLVVQLCSALITAGALPANIGVISPYRAQLDLISRSLNRLSLRVDTNTVDKYQGKDKDTIILSLVRSNSSNEIGDLLRDCRRVNVALTRAKKKLLVIGSRSTIRRNELFAKFLALVDENGWCMRLPKGAHKSYPRLKPTRPRRR